MLSEAGLSAKCSKTEFLPVRLRTLNNAPMKNNVKTLNTLPRLMQQATLRILCVTAG
jgi:hypothetical protein